MSRTITVTLTLSDEMAGEYQREAQATQRPVDDVIADELLVLHPTPANIQTRLAQLVNYTSNQLAALALYALPPERVAHYVELGEKLEIGRLAGADKQEFSYMTRRIEVYVLLRARALVLLQERGEDITPYLEAFDDQNF